ncbi:sugar-transfer associated ATP-grasp domain-containing protein [Truepera radiovictrix]|uniref:Alpha-L-glutamate ligase-related protein ATP-grasp domain-containing protein n=1 Tax=Truepera radiovictrix (strain DSM 17093 / CIP 108686 / LMG 22925 / RQ-24) TaxID=649638 RepID=D7CSE3_TRURR|nr:sugar-transfer associated ATP-grasp domain-containing protein [Truepera radiovictrix]ADI15363.1 hypothetical protein Trad_2253 [Truepera radiovictrix DSM 17093]WMT56086.1 sugar-transfer associated ATP-grasp domain-containing protein [Truepera radiovictrix]
MTRTDPRYGAKRPLRFLKKRLEYQREAPLTTSLPRRLAMWRGGLREASFRLYDLHDPEGAATYLPDTARLETFFINGSFAQGLLKDKLLFSQTLGALLPVPAVVGLIERGTFYPATPDAPPDLLGALAAYGSLVLKPSRGTRGQGVLRLEAPPLRLNGAPVDEVALRARVGALDDVIVTVTVPQAAYAEAIFPGSTNTVRVMTLRDPDTDEPFVARAVHRFGARGTEPTDNWSRGGLCALVEPHTGALSRGVKHAKRTSGKLVWQTHHPDTGAPIEGTVVPHWRALCEALLGAVRALPLLLYVGWDVVVTETGFCVLEGNANPDLDLLQVHGGLLRDPRVRRFYEHHRVI